MRCQRVGPTIPDTLSCVTSDDADQVSVAVLTMKWLVTGRIDGAGARLKRGDAYYTALGKFVSEFSRVETTLSKMADCNFFNLNIIFV